jgi:hypothetical protein
VRDTPHPWPSGFERSVALLAAALCLAALLVGAATVLGVHTVRAQGVRVPATALGVTSLNGPQEVYVRFLVGDSAVVATAESPGWTPSHGTRIEVAYLSADPAGSVRIVDPRVGGGYAPGVAGIAVGTSGGLLLGVAYVRGRRNPRLNPGVAAGGSPQHPNQKEPV